MIELSDSARALYDRLGVEGFDPELFAAALFHRSYRAENEGASSNERLEFLGDAVLGLAVTEYLYMTRPDLPEGDLARIRAVVVSKEALAPVGRSLGIGEALFLGRGEDSSGGRHKASLLADAFEALLGALYLSCGFSVAKGLVLDLLGDRIETAAAAKVYGDAKNRLQELAVTRSLPMPSYELKAEGPDHERHFFATVSLGWVLAHGEGRSKKAAERAAAASAIAMLELEEKKDARAAGEKGA